MKACPNCKGAGFVRGILNVWSPPESCGYCDGYGIVPDAEAMARYVAELETPHSAGGGNG